jgi:hypothetical protein
MGLSKKKNKAHYKYFIKTHDTKWLPKFMGSKYDYTSVGQQQQ